MSADKSENKQRQQAAWWVPALISLILAAIGIRYASSQGWWDRFNSSRPTYQTINTGFSVQSANSSEVPIGTQPLNPGNPSQPSTSTDLDSKQNNGNSSQGRRALW
jgi:hypothetical protein